ncbi:MAG TPA: class I SAM-dependent methyltransferase [Actinoplanes sp.]|nr:class I SAM-dependent methyltransferase [Actinoplanes sp.]
MTGEFSPTWLTLREPADAAARSTELVELLRDRLRTGRPEQPATDRPGFGGGAAALVIWDLGCGTGSLGRWLAPRLPLPQHWILQDRDPALLARAGSSLPDGVTVETRQGDVTSLTGDDLTGTSLLTCSALLDLLTAGEVGALAAACAVHGTPALFTLSVTGEVTFDPPDDRDTEVAAAFNAHQRRTSGGRRLLGPDAAETAAAAFGKLGATVTIRPSPWRLEAGSPPAAAWLRGWVAAAQEQRPDPRLGDYLRNRSGAPFIAMVGHLDVLAHFD